VIGAPVPEEIIKVANNTSTIPKPTKSQLGIEFLFELLYFLK
jgi:hypothetical protein